MTPRMPALKPSFRQPDEANVYGDPVTRSPMTDRSEVIRAAAWSAAEKWGNRALTTLVFMLLARFVGPAEFGRVAIASVFVLLVGVIVDSGLSKAVIQRSILDDEHAQAAFWTALGVGTGLMLLFVAIARPIEHVLNVPGLAPIIQLLAMDFLLGGLESAQVGLLRRRLQFRTLATRQLAATSVGGAVGIAMALNGAGAYALVAQVLASSAVGVVTVWIASPWRPRWEFSARHCKELAKFSIQCTGADLLASMTTYGDNLVIGVILGPMALGYYVTAFRMFSVVLELITSFSSGVALPVFARLQDQPNRLREAFLRATQLSSLVSIPAFVGLVAVAPLAIETLLGPKWGPSVPALRALCALGIVRSVLDFDRPLMLALGRSRLELLLTLSETLSNVLLFVVAAPHGVTVLAIAYSAKYYLWWPFRLSALSRVGEISLRRYFGQFGRPLLGSMLMYGVVMAVVGWTDPDRLGALSMVLGAAAGIAAYLVIMKALGVDLIRTGLSLARRPTVGVA